MTRIAIRDASVLSAYALLRFPKIRQTRGPDKPGPVSLRGLPAHLGAQLPMLIRGFYYEGWDPTGKPVKG